MLIHVEFRKIDTFHFSAGTLTFKHHYNSHNAETTFICDKTSSDLDLTMRFSDAPSAQQVLARGLRPNKVG